MSFRYAAATAPLLLYTTPARASSTALAEALPMGVPWAALALVSAAAVGLALWGLSWRRRVLSGGKGARGPGEGDAAREELRRLEERHGFLQSMLDAMPNPFFYKSPDGRYRLLNRAFEDMLDTDAEALLGKTVYDVSPNKLARVYEAMDKPLFESRGPAAQRYEHLVHTRTGPRNVVFSKESVFDEGGANLGLVGVVTDVTGLKEAKAELRRAEERFRDIFMNAAEGIFTSTPDGRFVDVNPAMARMLGYASPEELLAEVTDVEKQVWADGEDRRRMLDRLAAEGVINGMEMEAQRKDCSRVWLSLSLRAMFDGEGRLERIQGLAADVSERKHFELKLRRMATTDSLTSLPNRAQYEAALERMLAQARRSGEKVAVMYLDLNGFKAINDVYGHVVGDSLLVQVADRMRSRLRESDLAARIGGDEFAVLLWNVSSQDSAEAVGRDLARTLSREYVCGGVPCEVGASIGAALYPDDGEGVHELMDRADKAMYVVKGAGASGFAFASDVVGEPVIEERPVDPAAPGRRLN